MSTNIALVLSLTRVSLAIQVGENVFDRISRFLELIPSQTTNIHRALPATLNISRIWRMLSITRT